MGINDKPWLKPNPERVRLLGPVCVAYGHPDLEKTHEYLTDFGFVEDSRKKSGSDETVFYRGYGIQPVTYIARKTEKPQFLGAYFEVASEADLQKATKIPGASKVREWIAGGREVEITDPTGLPFHVVYGFKKRDFTPPNCDQYLPANFPAPTDNDVQAKPRRGKVIRLESGIIPIHKLGHCGYVASDFDESVDFYSTHFNFKASDVMLTPGPDGFAMLIFFHIDLGQEYTDHHCFFLVRSMGPLQPGTPHHAAFEVDNIDSQFIGHEYLERKGYEPFWGVGRHMEGSQVFDYWFDIDGFVLEHYADGDLVNEDHEPGWVGQRAKTNENNWGPAFPLAPPI